MALLVNKRNKSAFGGVESLPGDRINKLQEPTPVIDLDSETTN